MKQQLSNFVGRVVVLACYGAATLPILKTFPPVWPDEVLFYSPAANLAHGHGFGTTVLDGFLPGIGQYTFWLPPGHLFFLSVILRFVNPVHHLLAIRLTSWLLGVLVLLLGASILKRLAANRPAALLGLALLGTQVSFMQVANIARPDMASLACTMAALNGYLAYRESSIERHLMAAGLFAGLAMICHPAGILAPSVMAVHEVALPSPRMKTNYVKDTAIFAGCVGAVFVPWLAYIAQAPNLFLAQMAAQSVRKSSYLCHLLVDYGYKYWLMYPFRCATRPLGYYLPGLWPFHTGSPVLIPMLVLGVGLAGLLAKRRERTEASLLGAWALGGCAFCLFMPEFHYAVHFITPCCLLLGWAVAESTQKWMRAAALATLTIAAAWNFAEAKLIWWDSRDGWLTYQSYCLSLSRMIPARSTVLLAAIPDPYFGLLESNKSYRLYEFVPVGIPVDRVQAEQALARVDYVVGSDCCRPSYLADYLAAHGTIEAQLGQRDFLSPPIVLWKLRDRRTSP